MQSLHNLGLIYKYYCDAVFISFAMRIGLLQSVVGESGSIGLASHPCNHCPIIESLLVCQCPTDDVNICVPKNSDNV